MKKLQNLFIYAYIIYIYIYTTQVKKDLLFSSKGFAKHKWKRFQHLFINKHPTQTQAVKVTKLKSHHLKLYPHALTQACVNKNKPSYLLLNTFKHVKSDIIQNHRWSEKLTQNHFTLWMQYTIRLHTHIRTQAFTCTHI